MSLSSVVGIWCNLLGDIQWWQDALWRSDTSKLAKATS